MQPDSPETGKYRAFAICDERHSANVASVRILLLSARLHLCQAGQFQAAEDGRRPQVFTKH